MQRLVLGDDPKEIRATAVGAQRISDWLMAREWATTQRREAMEHEPSRSEAGKTREPGRPDRSEAVTAGIRDPLRSDHDPAERETGMSAHMPGSDGERALDSGSSR